MIKEEDKKKIENLFQEKKYDELDHIISSLLPLNKNDIPLNIYLFFFYECTNNNSEINNQFKKLKTLFRNKLDELYYQMGLLCKRLSRIRLSYYTQEDVFRFFRLAINKKSNHAKALFEIGKMLIEYKKNVKKGFELINKSIKIDQDIEELKIKFLLDDLTVVLEYPYRKLLYSKDKIKLVIKELVNISSVYYNNKYYLQKLKLYIALNNLKFAEKELLNINQAKINKYEKLAYYIVFYNFYYLKKDLKNALFYSEIINLDRKAQCFYDFKKYQEAIDVYNEILKQKSPNPNPEVINKIANSYMMLKKYKNAMDFAKKNLDDNIKLIYHKQYLDALMIKSKLELINKEYKEAMFTLRLAFNYFNEEQSFINNNGLKEDILLLKIRIYATQHIESYRKQKTLPIPDHFENLKKVEEIINYIDMQKYYNSQYKSKIGIEIKNLLTISNNKKKDIQKIENKIEAFEKKHSVECDEVIERCIFVAKKSNINNSNLMFILARIQYRLKKYKESISTYKKLLKIEPDNPTYLNNLAVAYDKINKKSKAIKLIQTSIKKGEFHENNISATDNLLGFLYEKSKIDESLKKDVEGASHKLINKVIIQDSALSHFTNKGIQNIQYLDLYKYKPFSTNTLDSIINNYFYFSEISKINDPIDIPLIEMSNKKQFDWLQITPADIKVFSLSLEKNNTLMWSHYADSHKGICIGYYIKSLPQYIGWDYINYIPENYDYQRMSKDRGMIPAGFYSKHINWEYEKEVRLTLFKNSNNKLTYKYPIEPIEKNSIIEGYISEITFGYKFQESHLEVIKSIVKKINKYRVKNFIPRILLYKTVLNPDYPFKLKKIRIR